jgi:hypothetical protein
MKIFLVLTFCLVSISQFVFAQTQFKPQTEVGIKGGTSFSRYIFNPALRQEPTMGHTGGFVLKHISEPNLGIQLELNYVQRGWTERIDSTQAYRRNLNFIEVPFMTHVAIGKSNTNFIANFGPSLAYLVSNGDSTKAVRDVEGPNYFQKEIENPLQFGLAIGIGVVRKSSLGIFQLEGRLTQSLTNIISGKQGLSSAKNTNVNVTVSYLMNIRPKN